jgi:hypothetical protein
MFPAGTRLGALSENEEAVRDLRRTVFSSCCEPRRTANGIFEMLFNQAFPPPQPDLFLAEEIARLKSMPND